MLPRAFVMEGRLIPTCAGGNYLPWLEIGAYLLLYICIDEDENILSNECHFSLLTGVFLFFAPYYWILVFGKLSEKQNKKKSTSLAVSYLAHMLGNYSERVLHFLYFLGIDNVQPLWNFLYAFLLLLKENR